MRLFDPSKPLVIHVGHCSKGRGLEDFAKIHTAQRMVVASGMFEDENVVRVLNDAKVKIHKGYGARPVYTVRINELLRRGGYLTPKGGGDGSKPSTKKKIKKIIKKTALSVVKGIGLPKWAMKLAKKFPVWKSLFASSADFDWDKTQAYLSDLSALKNYSYGGIRINDNVADKDKLADEIIEYLKPIKIEGEDKNLFEWIVRTNTFYHGQYLNKYPEIIYQMDERWGGEWELGKNVFEKGGFMYMMSPGGHRWRTAIIFANNFELKKNSYEMTDIYGVIMDAVKGE